MTVFDFLVNGIKARKIEIADQKIQLFGVGDIGFEEFGKELTLVGNESAHFYPLTLCQKRRKPLPSLAGYNLTYVSWM
jgi:hypothetical protein